MFDLSCPLYQLTPSLILLNRKGHSTILLILSQYLKTRRAPDESQQTFTEDKQRLAHEKKSGLCHWSVPEESKSDTHKKKKKRKKRRNLATGPASSLFPVILSTVKHETDSKDSPNCKLMHGVKKKKKKEKERKKEGL